MSYLDPPARLGIEARQGLVQLAARNVAGKTRIADLGQQTPLRLLFPRVAEGEPLTACIVNTAGGLVGGDRVAARVHVCAGARVLAIGQAAEKVYRSLGPACRIDNELAVESGGWLEYLPQETILFEDARLERRTQVELATGARAMIGEMLVFGRIARGERMTRGRVRDAIEIRREGRLVWADALHLDGDVHAALDHPAAFGCAHGSAILVAQLPEPERTRDLLRALPAPEGIRFGATAMSGLVLARWLAADTLALRRHFGAAWMLLRRLGGGLAERLPPLWHI